MPEPRKRRIVEVFCRICGKKLNEPDSKRRRISGDDKETGDSIVAGSVFTMGCGDTGQLGLGPELLEASQPETVELPGDVIQVVSGGMHTLCVTRNGMVFSFGLNDQGTLGRSTVEEEQTFLPARVPLQIPISRVSAGDNHTIAISDDMRTFIWGTFRDENGNLGLFPDGPSVAVAAIEIMLNIPVVDVSSGNNHVLCLTISGNLYSFGVSEFGRLGRIRQQDGMASLALEPGLVPFPRKTPKIRSIWTGQFTSFAKDDEGAVYAWGLNNYYQLGLGHDDISDRYFPEEWSGLNGQMDWLQIAGGIHHTLALDCRGRVYSVGRGDSGQLGIGRDVFSDREELGLIPRLSEFVCSSIACGTDVSFAITRNGTLFGWGAGNTGQLGFGETEDNVYVPRSLAGSLQTRKALMVSSGGQHTVVLTDEPLSKTLCDNSGHVGIFKRAVRVCPL